MEQVFSIAAVWLSLAVLSAVIAYHVKISIALVEICVGVATAAVASSLGRMDELGANQEWVRFLAASGAVLLTFLAGVELEPDAMRTKVKEVSVVGLTSFFAPFSFRTVVFVAVTGAVLGLLPTVTRFLTRMYGGRTAAIRTKWVILVLFGLGALAIWSGSEAVLPAYLAGMVLAEFSSGDGLWIRRLRTLTVGFLTPFYFIRAGTLVSLPTLLSAPLVFVLLLAGKVLSKILGLYPVIGRFRRERSERWYYTLLMSTGLTFGTISALYGLSNGIVTQDQYSFLVAVVIGSAVVPTLIAGFAFMPRHLLPGQAGVTEAVPAEDGLNEEG